MPKATDAAMEIMLTTFTSKLTFKTSEKDDAQSCALDRHLSPRVENECCWTPHFII